MRPVNKGEAPREYTDYRDAKPDLKERLGSYCSYCEMNISNQADVEHVSPKSKNPSLALKWINFLLGCKRCNLLKSDNNDDRQGYAFPDEENTAMLFDYTDGLVKVRDNLSEDDKKLAQAIYDLVELGNRTLKDGVRIDDRFDERKKSYEEAVQSLKKFEDYLTLLDDLGQNKDKIAQLRKEYVKTFERSLTGFHSVWLHVFKNYPEVKKAILDGVPGTAMECYDNKTYEPVEEIKRNNG